MKKAKENKNYRTSKGITLIPLIITVVLMMVLVGVVIANGLHSVDNVELQNFFKELQIIQKRVDVIHQEAKAGNNSFITYNEGTQSFISSIGIDVDEGVEISEVDNNEGYYLYTPENLKQLGIEGISQSVYINWSTRDVVSVRGITSKDTTYYRNSSDIKPNYIETEAKNIKTIITAKETNDDIKKLTVTEVITEDDAEITDFTLKYKSDGETVWRIADSDYFKTAESGKYYIQVSGNGINSKEETVYLYNLPDEYQEVDYIKSTGTQVIDTGFIPNQDTNVELDFALTNIPSNSDNRALIGTWTTGTNIYSVRIANNILYYFYGSDTSDTGSSITTDTNRHIIKSDANSLYYDGNLVTTRLENIFTCNQTISILAQHGTSSYSRIASAKIYNCKIWNNDNLVRDLIPCYCISDNEIGMYDLVNDVFYRNEGTGTFEMGNEI